MPSQKLVIGIDFGTTNTGVAYSLVTDPDDEHVEIEVIRQWPQGGKNRDASDKLPSDIAYDRSGHRVGCGFEIPEGVQALQWVKLFLDSDHLKQNKGTVHDARLWRSYQELKRLERKPVDVIADYLAWLWSQIKKNVELREDQEIFNQAEVTVVLTLPASWTDVAKDRMLQAARKAGIESQAKKLKFRSEPEAAAIFELKALAKRRKIAAGDCVIVCDAGGGTVDVVAFQVQNANQPLSLNQVTVCKGDFCGSAFVDAEFEWQLRSILGPDYDELSADVIAEMWGKFEYKIKRTYSQERATEYSIPVRGLPDENSQDRHIEGGRLHLPNAVIKSSFETVMTQIHALIDDQRDQLMSKGLGDKLKGILIVGGFGKSDYLYSRIRQEYPEDENITVWRRDHSWTAVVQGAVVGEIGSEECRDTVNERLSSYNYGIPYRVKSHDSSRKVQWLITKGQKIQTSSQTEPYMLRLQDQKWFDEDDYIIMFVPLVKTDDDHATEDLDSSVQPHVEIRCKVPTAIRHSSNATLIQDEPRVWRIPVTISLAMENGPLLSVKCQIQGKNVGTVELRYHDERPMTPSYDSAVSLMSVPEPKQLDEVRTLPSSASTFSTDTRPSPTISSAVSEQSTSPDPDSPKVASQSRFRRILTNRPKDEGVKVKKEKKPRKPIPYDPNYDDPYATGFHRMQRV